MLRRRQSTSTPSPIGGLVKAYASQVILNPSDPKKFRNSSSCLRFNDWEVNYYMNWKKLLLIGLVASGFAFAAAPRSDAGVSVGIGFGFPGYYSYGYPGYGYGYYPYGYYRPYPYYGYYAGPSFYWSGGHRVYYRHHRHHYYRRHY